MSQSNVSQSSMWAAREQLRMTYHHVAREERRNRKGMEKFEGGARGEQGTLLREQGGARDTTQGARDTTHISSL